MDSQDLHQVILRWPHTDANEVIVTGTFDKWACSLRLTRKPDGFEAPPIFIPWRHKMAYKFVVDSRWMTNDAEPTEVDHGFVNNVYTAPPAPPKPTVIPEPEPSTAPPSYHSESEVEHEPPAEKVPTTNEIAVVRETPTPTAADAVPAPEQQHPRVPDNEAVEAVRETVAAAVEATQAAVAQVAPSPADVDKAADEITSESRAAAVPVAPGPEILPIIPEIAPKVDNATAVDEQERSTHVPLRFASGTVVPQVEEPALSPESVPQIEVIAPALVVEDEEPEETFPVLVEEEEPEVPAPVLVEEEEPEESTPVLVEEEEPEVPAPVLVEEEVPEEPTPVLIEETEAPAAPEPAPAPPTESELLTVPVPAVVEEPVSAPAQEPEEVTAPAPASEPVPEVAAEPTAETVISPATTAEPTPMPVVEAAAPPAPSINGHFKNASTSTAAPSLPSTPTRKASRKFSFPGRGKDKSGNSSPTGSTRFASQQKRDKRHSLLGKLKEIFSDKAKKEKA